MSQRQPTANGTWPAGFVGQDQATGKSRNSVAKGE